MATKKRLPHQTALRKPRGDLTVADVTQVRDEILGAITANLPVKFDLAEVTYLDAAMLQMLAAARTFAKQAQVPFQLENVTHSLLNDAQLMGMQDVLTEHVSAD